MQPRVTAQSPPGRAAHTPNAACTLSAFTPLDGFTPLLATSEEAIQRCKSAHGTLHSECVPHARAGFVQSLLAALGSGLLQAPLASSFSLARVAGGGSLFFAFSHILTPPLSGYMLFRSTRTHARTVWLLMRLELGPLHNLDFGFFGAVRRLSRS